jgi:hypothetical protein
MAILKHALVFMSAIFILFATAAEVEAAVPTTISYQGRLTDAGGNPLNGNYAITFNIYADSIGGTELWSEDQPSVNVNNGLFSINLGSTNPLTSDYFSGSVRYLAAKVGLDPEMSPRTRITSSPYSDKVGTLDGSLAGTVTGDLYVDGTIYCDNRTGYTAITGYDLSSASSQNFGVDGRGLHGSSSNIGVYGEATDASQNPNANCAGIYGADISEHGGTVWAGYFDGWANVTGNFYAGGKFFKIDDPQDPANRTMVHSCVESDEYKNIYDGTITLDQDGKAIVTLPDWFDALNTEFRYQLTCIGEYAPIYIASKIENDKFTIAGGRSGLEVSWQVTGVRKDPYALAHPFQVVEEKPQALRGKYLHPKENGVSEELGIDYDMHQALQEKTAALKTNPSK